MCAEKKNEGPGYWWSIVNYKCARCRLGDMFQTQSAYQLRRFMKMNDTCPVCGQHMEIEPGFYYGTAYVSYAITVALSVSTFVAWWILIGVSVNDSRIFWWLGFNVSLLIVLQPFLMRIAKALWLSFFVKYNANWQTEKADAPERG